MIPFNRPLPSADGLWTSQRLAPAAPLDAQAEAAIVVQQGRIEWLGRAAKLPAIYTGLSRHDGGNALVTPSLVDCHTHLVYGSQQARKFAMRLAGASYEKVAQAGSGIVSSVRANRAATEDDLFASATVRLEVLLAEGVCAIEIKSGHGLALADERKQLRMAHQTQAYGVTVRTTFLGAHALPSECAERSSDYIDRVGQKMMPALAAERLIDAIDVFCERIAFSLDETERVFQAAQALGLPVKLHAELLSDMGGAALAAWYGALSCDHIEHLSQAGTNAIRTAGTVAVLLPGANYTLHDTHLPPIAALRAADVPMAVSTDHNSPALSLLLMVNMACTLFRLKGLGALTCVTVYAAGALGLQAKHGMMAVGMPANFVL